MKLAHHLPAPDCSTWGHAAVVVAGEGKVAGTGVGVVRAKHVASSGTLRRPYQTTSGGGHNQDMEQVHMAANRSSNATPQKHAVSPAHAVALACGATVLEGDVERIKHDTAPAGAGGEVVVVRICGVSKSNSGGQGQVAEELRAVEVVAGAGMCVSLKWQYRGRGRR